MFQLCSLKLVQLNLIGQMRRRKLLAEIIGEGLGFENNFSNSAWTSTNIGEPVLMTLGGGHYAPKANKLALEENVWLGHMLANHSSHLVLKKTQVLWKQSIDAALSSTKKAFPEEKSSVMLKKIIQRMATSIDLRAFGIRWD